MVAKKKATAKRKPVARKKSAVAKSKTRADIATRFQPGNKFWEARSSHGRKPIFKDPQALHDACLQYFDWNTDNPLISIELVKYQGEAKQVEVPKLRAMTMIGLYQFIDIDQPTWGNYKAKPDFLITCLWAEDIIYRQKVEGASVDLLNPNFIGKLIGLTDKSEVINKNASIELIEPDYVEPE